MMQKNMNQPTSRNYRHEKRPTITINELPDEIPVYDNNDAEPLTTVKTSPENISELIAENEEVMVHEPVGEIVTENITEPCAGRRTRTG